MRIVIILISQNINRLSRIFSFTYIAENVGFSVMELSLLLVIISSSTILALWMLFFKMSSEIILFESIKVWLYDRFGFQTERTYFSEMDIPEMLSEFSFVETYITLSAKESGHLFDKICNFLRTKCLIMSFFISFPSYEFLLFFALLDKYYLLVCLSAYWANRVLLFLNDTHTFPASFGGMHALFVLSIYCLGSSTYVALKH